MKRIAMLAVVSLAFARIALAGTPPDAINYQGVLRDSANQPLTGSFDMVFRFWSAASGGLPILLDRHTGPAGAVSVSGGLFNVQLGRGVIEDGPGGRTYTSLAQVFAEFSTVYLSIDVSGQELTPRIEIVSAPYALNANALGGMPAAQFIDVGATAQTKSGPLRCEGGLYVNATADPGLEAHGPNRGGAFYNATGQAYGYAADVNTGVSGYGVYTGGSFYELGYAAGAHLGASPAAVGAHIGVYGFGNDAGGHFTTPASDARASLALGQNGIQAFGNPAGDFRHLSGTGNALLGTDGVGVYGNGSVWGGQFSTVQVFGVTETYTLRITGGADLAESFEARAALDPGSVVVIDDSRPGAVALAGHAYDPRVAGIVAGAGGISPGVTLNGHASAGVPLALSGRAYCLATDENGPIRPGDLLTTSSVPGHAMRASDPARSFGAVLGKAMSALNGKRGLVLVLVNLQ